MSERCQICHVSNDELLNTTKCQVYSDSLFFIIYLFFIYLFIFDLQRENQQGGGEVKMPATPRLRLTGTNARQDVIVYQAIVCTLVHTDVIAKVCYALLTQFEKYNSLL